MTQKDIIYTVLFIMMFGAIMLVDIKVNKVQNNKMDKWGNDFKIYSVKNVNNKIQIKEEK